MVAPAPEKSPARTVKEAAQVFSEQLGREVPRNTVWGWVKSGKITARKFGGKWYIDGDAMVAFLEGTNPAKPTGLKPGASFTEATGGGTP